jgi:hypothetical protein
VKGAAPVALPPGHGHGYAREHEVEPQFGLPEALPEGERLLWQGAPVWRDMALHCFHVRMLSLYFGVILVLRAVYVASAGGSASDALLAALWLTPLALAALGTALFLAWLSARTTVYTITDRRVVMRVGMVLSITFNLPYKRIHAAGLAVHPSGTGDIPLTLGSDDRIAIIHLWPHARPWRMGRPEPMLRCVPQGALVARILSDAWAQATGLRAAPAASPSGVAAEPRDAQAGGQLSTT